MFTMLAEVGGFFDEPQNRRLCGRCFKHTSVHTQKRGQSYHIDIGLTPFGFLAGATRLELATSGVTGRRSDQTELRPLIFFRTYYYLILIAPPNT